MTMRHVTLQTAGDGFATLLLDNADETNNLVTEEFIAELLDMTARIAADNSIKGVLVKSAKASFMAGADLKLMVQGHATRTLESAYALSQRATAMHRAMERSGKCWVALINGFALGGGFELALACHYRILERSPKAVVGLPEVNVGLLPGSGGTQRLIRIAGVQAGIDLLLSGRAVKADEALELGIVDVVAPLEEMDDVARAWLAGSSDPVKPWDRKGWALPEQRGLIIPEHAARMTMATGGLHLKGASNPAPAAILSCIYEGAILPFDKALAVEGKYFARLLTNPVSRNIIRTTFLSKAAAERGARRPGGGPKATFRKVGVIGAGMMGAGIALVAAQSGCEVILIDRDQATADKGKAYSERFTEKRLTRGTMQADGAQALLDRIAPTDDFARLEGCDIVIEAVFEDIDIKADTTRKVEAVIRPDTIYCTNTSTLPISRLAEASARPDQFIGLHFFSPVEAMGLVEIIRGNRTSPQALAKALDFVALLRKTPIVVNDSRGFYTSRVFQTMIHEGARMLGDGIPAPVIENAARKVGLPVGPLALLDEVTLDLPLKIIDQALAQDEKGYVPPAGVDVMRKMVAMGRLGRKSGGAFYDYPEGGRKQLWSDLRDHFPSSGDYDADEVGRRLLVIQALETARCFEEGVIETPEDGDLGSVYGWNFPSWTGGTLSYIDTIGIATFVKDCDALAQKYGPRFLPSAWLRDRARAATTFY